MSEVVLAHGPVDMSFSFSFQQMIQTIITSESDRVTGEKVSSKQSSVAEDVLEDELATGHAAANNSLKDAFYSYVENVLTANSHNGTLGDNFTRNL